MATNQFFESYNIVGIMAVPNYFFTVLILILFASRDVGNPEYFLFIGKKFRRFYFFLSHSFTASCVILINSSMA